MKGRAIIPLVLGLCVGLIAVKYLVNTLQNAKGSTADSKIIPVVRAVQDIDSYEQITADMVELVETTDETLAPSQERITALDEAIGRVTAKAVPQRSPILQSMLAPPDTPPGMVGRIPAGYRAVSVKIDEVTGVAYQLKPGSWVDVIVVMDVVTGTGRSGKETIAEVLLQHVQVAAIGRSTSEAGDASGSKVKPAKSATLFVRERDAPKLHLAATRGKVTLAMRGDDSQTTTEPITARGSEVFSFDRQAQSGGDATTPPAPPTKAFPPPAPVEMPHSMIVYRGLPKGVAPLIEQITFADSDSRTIVGLGTSPISRVGRVRLEDEFGTSRTQSRDGRTGAGKDQSQADVPGSQNMEAE